MRTPLDLAIKNKLADMQMKHSLKQNDRLYQKALKRIDKKEKAEEEKEYDRLLKTDMKEQIEREKEKNRQKKADALSDVK